MSDEDDSVTYEQAAARANRKMIRPVGIRTLSDRGVRRGGSVPDDEQTPVYGEASRTTTPPRKPRRRHSDKVKAITTQVVNGDEPMAA